MDTGIYEIIAPSGKRYIGSAVSFRARWSLHKTELRAGRHHSAPLQRAATKYGIEALRFEKLLVCAKSDLLFYEQRAIDAHGLRRLYNCAPTAGSRLGAKSSLEHCERISRALKGRVMSPEWLQKLRDATRPRLSPEHKAKIGVKHKGRQKADSERLNLSAARNTSGFMYVVYDKTRDLWIARPRVDGKAVNIGRYATALQAHQAIVEYLAGR